MKIKIKNKRKNNKIFNIFTKFFLSSSILILFFWFVPIFINFANKNLQHKEFTNNSKNILNNVLKKR